MAQHLNNHVHFRQLLNFNSKKVPDSSYRIFQMQAIENCVYVSRQGCLYLLCVGKRMVRQYLRRRDYRGGLYRHTAGS